MSKKTKNMNAGSVETTQPTQLPEATQPAAVQSKAQLVNALAAAKQKIRVSEAEPTVEPQVQETEEADYDTAIFPIVTFTRPLTYDEAVQLKADFDRYAEANKSSPGDRLKVYRYTDSEIDALVNDQDEPITVSVTRYTITDNVYWFLREFTELVDTDEDVEQKTYRLDIEYDFELMSECDDTVYDGNLLKSMMERSTHVNEASDISPLLENYSSLVLTDIEYDVVELRAGKDVVNLPDGLRNDLLRCINMPVEYSETETFTADTKKGEKRRDAGHVLSSTVRVTDFKHGICFIRRSFHNAYTLKELLESDSPVTKRIIEQMFSCDYRCRVTANYLKLAMMGGNYYSMDRAMELIKSRFTDEYERLRFICALVHISNCEGIGKAKSAYRNSEPELRKFHRCLDDLVAFGINPVTIPAKYIIDCIPIPLFDIDRYCKRVVDVEKMTSFIEVQEKVGGILLDCPVSW